MRAIFAVAMSAVITCAQLNISPTDNLILADESENDAIMKQDDNLKTEVSETLDAFFEELVAYNYLDSLKDCKISSSKSTLDAAMQFAEDIIARELFATSFQSGINLSASIVGSLKNC